MTKNKREKSVFCDGNCPRDPDEPCGKTLPTYEVDVIRNEGAGRCSMLVTQIEQMNTVGWPLFVAVKTPDDLRDMLLAAVLTYQFGEASIDRHWARVRMMRETDNEIDSKRKLN